MAPYRVGVKTPPTTEPRQTHKAQIPVAEPIFSGATYFWTASGPQMVTKINATPSIPRETIRTVPLPAKAPTREPMATTTAAARSMVLGPNFLASAPVGKAKMMPTKVKMDMSHEAEPGSMFMLVIMSPMTTGTLNWTVAIAVPNSNIATAISAQFAYFLSVFITRPPSS